MNTAAFNIKDIVRKNLLNITPYSSARDEYVSDGSAMVFLDANENPYENGVNRYPDPQQRRLKSVLADQKGIDVDTILLGNGSDEVLDLLFRAFCEPKQDNVITLPPTYGMYSVLASINDVEERKVLLDSHFQPKVGEILGAIDAHSKLVFLCSPNNPTGNSFSEDKIIEILENFKGLVVIDEAYIDFSIQESWVKKIKKYPNLVVTQTLSKAYGLAGIRLGICYASQAVITVLNKIKPPYNVNELTQQRALERVLDQQIVTEEVGRILEQRNLVLEVLHTISFVRTIYPTDANFVLIEVDDANRRYTQLLEKGIVIRNRSTQPLCEQTLRLTIGTAEENDHLITVLKQL